MPSGEIVGPAITAAQTLAQTGPFAWLFYRMLGVPIRDLAIAGVDVPKAWLERHSERQRSLARAESLQSDAVARAVAERLASEPELIERTALAELARLTRDQTNKEAVLFKASHYYHLEAQTSEGAAGQDSQGGDPPEIDEDFLNQFERFACNASSERMRDFLARVLAGQLRRPGSFSLRALHVLSVLDRTLAEALQAIHPFSQTWSGAIPQGGDFSRGRLFAQLSLLADHGLIRMSSISRGFALQEDGSGAVVFGKGGLVVRCRPGTELSPSIFQITPVGMELFSLMEGEPAEADAIVYANAFAEAANLMHILSINWHPIVQIEDDLLRPVEDGSRRVWPT